MAKGTCGVADCAREVWATGLCGLHYGRKRRTGSVHLQSPESAEQRFLARVDTSGPTPAHRPDLGPCWVWTGYVMPTGYGFWQFGTRKTTAHRYAYELADGPIPDGLHIDHLCRVRSCVRRSHLEAVTQAENNRRAGPIRVARKPKCPQGHKYAGANLYVAPNGQRVCRTCRDARVRAFKRRARGLGTL